MSLKEKFNKLELLQNERSNLKGGFVYVTYGATWYYGSSDTDLGNGNEICYDECEGTSTASASDDIT